MDISIPLKAGPENITAWYVDPPRMEPVMNDMFTGSVKKGGDVNFRDIFFNPHGHGTHTECVGHISEPDVYISNVLRESFFVAHVITVTPRPISEEHDIYKLGDLAVMLDDVKSALKDTRPEALVIRTLPNDDTKMGRQYSNTNPPYLHSKVAMWLANEGINHLLVDLPSVDPEVDGGKLIAHRAYWQYPEKISSLNTITELVYVPGHIPDGRYIMNLQTAHFVNDATPSRPVLYPIKTSE